jgi:hypothetical protein
MFLILPRDFSGPLLDKDRTTSDFQVEPKAVTPFIQPKLGHGFFFFNGIYQMQRKLVGGVCVLTCWASGVFSPCLFGPMKSRFNTVMCCHKIFDCPSVGFFEDLVCY